MKYTDLIIDKIIEERKAKKITQKDVSSAINMKLSTYSSQEQKRIFNLDAIIGICEFLEIDFIEIVASIMNKDKENDNIMLTYTTKDLQGLQDNINNRFLAIQESTNGKFQMILDLLQSKNQEPKQEPKQETEKDHE